MGHVHDTPVLTKMILNECMMYHMKVHIFSYNLGPKKSPKSRMCILPNYEQTDSKTAIVIVWKIAHSGFGRSFNPISTIEGRLCHQH